MAFIHKILLTCKDATLLTCKKQENAISFKENIESNTLQLDETKKAALQLQLDAELEK